LEVCKLSTIFVLLRLVFLFSMLKMGIAALLLLSWAFILSMFARYFLFSSFVFGILWQEGWIVPRHVFDWYLDKIV